MAREFLKSFIKVALVDAAVILVIGSVLNYVFPRLMTMRYNPAYAATLIPPFFDTLPVYTLIAALLAMLGKAMGALGSVYSAGRATLVSESVSGYVSGVTEEAERMGASGWLPLLAGSAIAVAVAVVLSIVF